MLYMVFEEMSNDLLRLYREKKNEYHFKHMTKIKESIRQHRKPRVMESRKGTFGVEWPKEERGLCGIPKKKALVVKELCSGNCFTCAHFREGEW